jgi:glucosylceramidase
MKRNVARLLIALALPLASGIFASAQQLQPAQEWLTTATRSALFAHQSQPLDFSSPSNTLPVVQVNDMQHYQSMVGFGCALTGGSARLLMQMSPSDRTTLLRHLFAKTGNGLHISFLRVSIGSSDMNTHPYTYDDLPAGQTDPTLNHFSLSPDAHTVLPVLKQILAINPDVKILGSPWSAPAWMKTDDSLKGGHLKTENYPVYAHYFVKYIEAMRAQGIPLYAITVQNEPLNPKNTPSMVMFASEEDTFLAKSLIPAFHKAGIHTRVWLYDHNPDVPSYPLSILADPAVSPYVDGTAFHLYGGEPSTLTKVHNEYPNKSLYMTEQSITSSRTGPLPVDEAIHHVFIGATRNWSRLVLLWNLAADPNDGPHTNNGGCTSCQGALTLSGNQVTRNLAYYALAHFSSFVPPGSIRIGSTQHEQLFTVAFLTPQGHIVLVVSNTGNFPKAFDVKFHGHWFQTTLPEESAATYVW